MTLRVLIILNILLTIILISLGGFVHNTGASLACPDWPLCYGEVLPVMEGSVLIEHSHRLLASLVGFLCILIVIFAKKTKPVIFGGSIAALILVIFQGVLGGMTVIFKLPTIVSTAHLGTSMLFLATLFYLYHKAYFQVKRSASNVGNLHTFAKWTLIIVYLQMLLGAFMRHSGLGGVCGVGYDSALICNDLVDSVVSWFPTSSEAQLHVLHRYMGVVAGLMGLGFSFFFRRVAPILSGVIAFIVIAQVALGIMTVGSNLGVAITTLHLTGATLLFVLLWKSSMVLKSQRMIGQSEGPSYLEDILDLAKPRLSSLVIFTATLGMLLAPGEISFMSAFLGILSTTGIVAGACALNCYMERDVDLLMLRTANRPLPKKRIPKSHALNFGVFFIIVFTVVLYFSTNLITTLLAVIATVSYVAIYTPMKRKSSWSVVVGALPGAIPPLMGWTMVTGVIDTMGMVLFGILFIWQLPHFMAIATFRLEEYKKAGLVVTPIVNGLSVTKYSIFVYTLLLMILSFAPIQLMDHGKTYLVFSALIGLMFLALAFRGLFMKNEDLIKQWARGYFWGSIMYLPVLFLGLVFLS